MKNKRKMKISRLLGLVLLSFVVILTGCDPTDEQVQKVDYDPNKPITITSWPYFALQRRLSSFMMTPYCVSG